MIMHLWLCRQRDVQNVNGSERSVQTGCTEGQTHRGHNHCHTACQSCQGNYSEFNRIYSCKSLSYSGLLDWIHLVSIILSTCTPS